MICTIRGLTMNRKGITALALLMAGGAAQAAEWVLIGQNAHETRKLFVDISSIRIAGEIRRAWFRSVEAPHKTKIETGQVLDYRLERWAFHCRDEIAKLEASTEYYEDGTNYSGGMDGSATPAIQVRPDTVLRSEMMFVCSWKSK